MQGWVFGNEDSQIAMRKRFLTYGHSSSTSQSYSDKSLLQI